MSGSEELRGERGSARFAELGSGATVELARPAARLAGRVVDIFIVGFVWLALYFAWAAATGADAVGADGALAVGQLGLMALWAVVDGGYEVTLVALRGRTPGKRWAAIRVISRRGGAVPGWSRAFRRWAVPYALGLVLSFVPYLGGALSLLCYVSLTWDRDRQGWHDKAAGTLVTRA